MIDFFKELFCPIHGLLRPDATCVLMNFSNTVVMHATILLKRLGVI